MGEFSGPPFPIMTGWKAVDGMLMPSLPPHWNSTHYSRSHFAPEMATESNRRSKTRIFRLILVHWVHFISVYGFCHCRDGLCVSEYRRGCIRTRHKCSSGKCVCVCVCVRTWWWSLTCINMQGLTLLSKQRPRDLHTSNSPAIISTS